MDETNQDEFVDDVMLKRQRNKPLNTLRRAIYRRSRKEK